MHARPRRRRTAPAPRPASGPRSVGPCASTRPSRSSTSRRHSAAAKFRSCVESTIVTPSVAVQALEQRAALRAGGRRRATPSARRAAAARGLCASALAMTTRCFSPPLSVPNDRPSNAAVPVASSARRAMARSSGPSSANGAEVRVAAHQHDVEHAEVERRVRLLRHEGDPPRGSGATSRPAGGRRARSTPLRLEARRRAASAASSCRSRSGRGGRRDRRARRHRHPVDHAGGASVTIREREVGAFARSAMPSETDAEPTRNARGRAPDSRAAPCSRRSPGCRSTAWPVSCASACTRAARPTWCSRVGHASAAESDEKSLSTNSPMRTPFRSAVSRFACPCRRPTNPEWRGRRNSGWPG